MAVLSATPYVRIDRLAFRTWRWEADWNGRWASGVSRTARRACLEVFEELKEWGAFQ